VPEEIERLILFVTAKKNQISH